LRELKEVLLDLSHDKVQRLIQEMKREDAIHKVGERGGARWYAGPGGRDCAI